MLGYGLARYVPKSNKLTFLLNNRKFSLLGWLPVEKTFKIILKGSLSIQEGSKCSR